jgi:hypothetical protein
MTNIQLCAQPRRKNTSKAYMRLGIILSDVVILDWNIIGGHLFWREEDSKRTVHRGPPMIDRGHYLSANTMVEILGEVG